MAIKLINQAPEQNTEYFDYCDIEEYNHATRKTLTEILWFIMGYGFLLLGLVIVILTIIDELFMKAGTQ